MSPSPATRPEVSGRGSARPEAHRRARPRALPAYRGPRLLVVVRWPVGGIRTHLLVNFPAVRAAGYRCTFVRPADGSLDALADGLGHPEGGDFVGVPVRGRGCR